MKAVRKEIPAAPAEFQPFTLELTVESAKEARTLYTLFNWKALNEATQLEGHAAVREAIGHDYRSGPNFRNVTKRVKKRLAKS